MIPDLQAYHYDGPAEFHAIVGQIMAYLGYAGGMNHCRLVVKSY